VSFILKIPKENNRPIGENSPNLVILMAALQLPAAVKCSGKKATNQSTFFAGSML
jgi:hypothetical protein